MRRSTIAKLAVSLTLLALVYWKLIAAVGASELWTRLSTLTFRWLLVGIAAQLIAMSFSILRWHRLLLGQGIHAPLRHLLGAFMIGRFFGELAPGGWTGLNGYRIYDIAKHTGKVARATATIAVEMVVGWMSFGAVVVVGSLWGARFIGTPGVVLVDAFFLCLIGVALALLSKPALFRRLAQHAPASVAGKLRTTVDAVCAYEGQSRLLLQAAWLGVATHVTRAFIYVAAARALAAELSVGEVIFGSSLQVFATMLPASLNGIGLREATAVALYTSGGVPESTAVLIPTVGFLLELSLSSLGGLWFLARRGDYHVAIRVDHADHEDAIRSELPAPTPPTEQPRVWHGAGLGLGAGLLAGAAIGGSEAALIVAQSAQARSWDVLPYGGCAYALCLGALGAGLGALSAWSGRWLERRAVAPALAFARGAAGLFGLAGFAIGAFR
ncbi:MAG: lysylphosphatidylglycerol synthase transmembrane domain-containing protein, partial [Polyangiales bacterium]